LGATGAIALTGGTGEDVRRSAEAVFVAHLTKPVNLRPLEPAVRQYAACTPTV